MRVLVLCTAQIVLLIAGCTIGPDFHKPKPPDVHRYTSQPLSPTMETPGVAGGRAQRFVIGSDVSGDWWTLFHCKALNTLIAQSLRHNPDLKAAQAALSAAREDVLAQRGVYYPTVTGGFSANRQRMPLTLAPVPNYPVVPQEYKFSLFTPQVNVSYVPDVFGLNRRTVESLQAQEQAVRFQAIATYNTLIANVVVTAIQEAALRQQLDATKKLVGIESKMLAILQYQFDKGYASRLDVAAQKSKRAQVAASLPPLLKQQARLQHLLAVLVGRFPDRAPAETFTLSSLILPQQLPLSLPSTLVAQRPDVRQAQANLHAASAQVGIAIADRLPNIVLSANAGSTALAIEKVFTAGTGFWSVGASLAAPIFQGGTLLHEERAAKAAYVQAAAQYRSAVLTAFQNVADTLTALEQDAAGVKAAASAEDAAKVTLDLSRRQVRDGYAGDLVLLNAEQAWQQARIALVQAQADRYADTAALFQALGGGWWHRTDLAKDSHEN